MDNLTSLQVATIRRVTVAGLLRLAPPGGGVPVRSPSLVMVAMWMLRQPNQTLAGHPGRVTAEKVESPPSSQQNSVLVSGQ